MLVRLEVLRVFVLSFWRDREDAEQRAESGEILFVWEVEKFGGGGGGVNMRWSRYFLRDEGGGVCEGITSAVIVCRFKIVVFCSVSSYSAGRGVFP